MARLNLLAALIFIFFVVTIVNATEVSNEICDNYSKSQVDSLISAEVERQVDDQLITLKIKEVASETLEKYVTIENNLLALLALVISIVVVFVPLYINRRHEKLIDEKLKENQEAVNTHIKISKHDIKEQVEEGLQKLDKSYEKFKEDLIAQQEYTILLIRALNNDNEDIKLNFLNEIIKRYEKNWFVASAYNCRGNVFFHKIDYERAILDYTKAIEKDSSFADAYYNRGNAYTSIDKYMMALSDYAKAMEINPDAIDYYISRGNAYLKKGDNNLAIEDYTKVLQTTSDNSDVYLARGLAFSQNGNYHEAVVDYTKAIEINPNEIKYYIARGNALSIIKEYDYAIDDYTKATELDSEYGEAYRLRGIVYNIVGKTNKAKADFKKAANLGFHVE